MTFALPLLGVIAGTIMTACMILAFMPGPPVANEKPKKVISPSKKKEEDIELETDPELG